MGIIRVTSDQVSASSVETLGLDSEIADLSTPEVLAAAVRRAASFICPASPRLLTQAVDESLRGLLDVSPADTELGPPVRAMVETLIAHGDLVEAPIDDEDRGTSHRMVFLGQPAYVRVSESRYVLLGVPAEGLALLDDALSERVDHDAHVRTIKLVEDEDPAALFETVGLRELSEDHWLKMPPPCAPDALVSEYDIRLESAGPSGTIDGCSILDASEPVTYYRGRWRRPNKADTGRYVARRPLEFGPDAWCYAELRHGEVLRILDLPVHHRLDRGCDEAWRLQAAIDRLAGIAQKARVAHHTDAGRAVLHLLSPVPSWVQRRLDTVGRPLPRQRGSLISYSLAEEQLQEELTFLSQTMWIELDDEGGSR